MLTPLTDLVEADKPSRRREHLGSVPLGAVAWVLLGLVIAAYLGPWLSNSLGVTLPAFAMVRTGGPNERLSLRGLADRIRKYF
jgi:hypothetical protein